MSGVDDMTGVIGCDQCEWVDDVTGVIGRDQCEWVDDVTGVTSVSGWTM